MTRNNFQQLKTVLKQKINPSQAKIIAKFFKTTPGGYAEKDRFLGIPVPELRKLAKNYADLNIKHIIKLITSIFHEERFLGLLILILRFQTGSERQKKQIYQCYIKYMDYVNSWDLVDQSAGYIIGAYLEDKAKTPLFQLACSQNLWKRRIAVVATLPYIKKQHFQETLHIAKMLMYDEEELIHKAVGWMLREIGKLNLAAEEFFLKLYSEKMPRTMLRYATEKFTKAKRKKYLLPKK